MSDFLNYSYEEENSLFTMYYQNDKNNFSFENNWEDTFNNIFNNNNNEERSTGESSNVVEQNKIENKPGLLKKKRGRGKGKETGETNGKSHNRFVFDNKIKKIKSMIIKVVFNYINKKIFIIYNGNIGHGDNIKKLFLINHAQVSNANIDFNRTFLEKTLGEIFSADLSKRIINYKRDHNKKLIEKLKNEEDEEKNEYFNGLFNLTFLDCLKYFRNENVNHAYVYIEGLKRFSDLENDAIFRKTNDSQFIEEMKLFINNFENDLGRRRGRNSLKNHNINIEN